MKIEYISPADLIPYSKNAKRHPSEQVKLIANSIKEFGFQQPIVVDKDNIVIIGHGRLLASKRLKLAEVPITRVENLTEDHDNFMKEISIPKFEQYITEEQVRRICRTNKDS